MLNPSRMRPLFLILRRNREWWGSRARPRAFARVRFPGSRITFEYYPGHGLQIQPLANFAAANGYFLRRTDAGTQALTELLDDMSQIAVTRGTFLTWEYYFPFSRGKPPWTSSISQGTAVQAYSRAAARLARPAYFETARQALGAFETRTPVGVRVPLGPGAGSWYVLYSFQPSLRVLNAHTQALNGLFDFGKLANDDRGRALFQEGFTAELARIRSFDTGAWSKYSNPGVEANLNYHKLNADLVSKLCERVPTEAVVCQAGANFRRYTREPPRIGAIRTGRPRRNRPTSVSFFLSKVGSFSVYVKRGGRVVRSSGGSGPRGQHRLRFRAPATPGPYRVDVLARDLAGNRADRSGKLRVR
jgi:hypothetical protein